MIDAIIFDVDGTLVDSRIQVRIAWNSMVEKLTGHPWNISDGEFTSLFGQPMTAIAIKLFPEEKDEAERLRKASLCYDAENEWLWEHHSHPFPGVAETLECLSASYPLYIVSNCQQGYIEAALQPLGLLDRFQGWLCFGDTGTSKGETMLRLMKQHGLHSPVYVGDTQGDEDACRVAGIPFIYAAWGFGQAAHPDWTAAQVTDLRHLCADEEAL